MPTLHKTTTNITVQGAMATALPSIVNDLGGQSSFVWISASYSLATTVVIPLSGRLAEIYGRCDVLLAYLAVSALGSGICAGAQPMNMLIAGRGLFHAFLLAYISKVYI